MKFTARPTVQPGKATLAAASRYQRLVREAAVYATDRAAAEAQQNLRERFVSTGLGRLNKAVSQTSMLKKGQSGDAGRRPYGVIFAKDGDDGRTAGAIDAYTRGATIRPKGGREWLAFPTRAVPRFVVVGGKRTRNTPTLYMQSGLMQSIGKLEFRPISDKLAIWVIKRVSVSPKTGQAKRLGPRRTRTRVVEKEVVAFIGIRVTVRAKRTDKDGVVGFSARRVPRYMQEYLARRMGGA